MYSVNCKGCGRPVMVFNRCSACQTLDRSEEPKPDYQSTPAAPMSPGSLALLAGLMAAGVAYWKTADEATAALAGVAIWLVARTSIGQTLIRVALAVAGLALIWLVWTFFNELSKTYR